ncbi:four helix bundle protein [Halomonas eurihalina]|uniref:Four helix bundle protein n=1 Tax=Halomonas eurihalina TaxID=42566 RepID=A0A5D9DA88_HALER|nr:four helix bundle protein [Halomonas eurihalina]MDR5858470.1 four helix bundle protein [Halomonas eurihalina]TZG40666.1 four helix bundle protein [Halomonas eurihalina]
MNFERLEVWKRSARMSAELYKALVNLRDFGFRDQITRSGLSIPSNIAEGMSRRTKKDKSHFLVVARGSCAELRTQVYIGMDIGYIDEQQGRQWLQETREISSMLHGLLITLDDE